jgi:hypothetical protein
MTIDRRGRYWFLFDREMPTVFDRNGRFVATVGRKGRGPGEFNSPTSVMAVPGDSVVIFDFGVPTSLIGPDLKFVRAIRTPPVAVFAAVPAEWPRTVWIHGESPIPQLAGWPLHVLQLDSASAEISKSVGLNDGELLAGKAYRLLHKLAKSRTGDVWAVEMLDYRISRWTSHGALIEVLQRRPDWFSAPSNAQLGSGHDKPAEPVIQGIGEDAAGRLWISTTVATRDWIELWKSFPRPQGTVEVRPDWGPPYHKLYETKIEVIDPIAKRLVASTTIPYAAVGTLPNNDIVTYAVDDSTGAPILRILSVRLRS